MGTKMKGFSKAFKYISHIFDEPEQEDEIQIGAPTDVKHVAHIGADGPATESPSWMRKFDSKDQSGQTDPKGGPDKTKSSEGTGHRPSRSEGIPRDVPDLPKASKHRRRSMENALEPGSKDSTTKSKHTRRHHKGSSDGSHKGRHLSQESVGDESPSSNKLPAIPKKSRRKKSKGGSSGGSSKTSKNSDGQPSPFDL